MQIKSKSLRLIGRIIDWGDQHRFLSMALVCAFTTTTIFGISYWYKETYGVTVQNRITYIFTALLFIILVLFLYISLFRKVINERFDWTMDVINNLSQKIEILQNERAGKIEEVKISSKWPWGDHHTKDLEHLAAAANRFWTLYDPSDFTTAPTNKVVADWLVSNRGVARDRANYMASILRADGLPDGPRR